jgi:hypothetical protein
MLFIVVQGVNRLLYVFVNQIVFIFLNKISYWSIAKNTSSRSPFIFFLLLQEMSSNNISFDRSIDNTSIQSWYKDILVRHCFLFAYKLTLSSLKTYETPYIWIHNQCFSLGYDQSWLFSTKLKLSKEFW